MTSWLARLSAKYWRMILLMIVAQAGCAFLIALQPKYFQQIITVVIHEKDFHSEGMHVLGILAAIYFGGTLLQSFSGYAGCVFSSDLLRRLQLDFFETTSCLPLQYFQEQSAGEFFTKFNNDIGLTQRLIASVIPTIAREFLTGAIIVVILFYACPVILTCSALMIVMMTGVCEIKLQRILERYATEQRTGIGKINFLFDETVQGIDTLKIFNAEALQSKKFRHHTADLRDLSVRAGKMAAIYSPGIDLFAKICGLFLLILAYWLVSNDSINLEQFLLFFFYATLLQNNLLNILNLLTSIQVDITGARNIFHFFQTHTEEKEQDTAATQRIDGSVPIKIRNLSFSYSDGKAIFTDANLLIPSKSITLIHGPSGIGKSTLINMLLRFHTPQRGNILYGDNEIAQFGKKELREKIGIVPQTHHIFNESLKNNLLIAKPGATDEEIMYALKKAQLENFVKKLPDGIDEIIEPRGKKMSGGERQRICLARLFLRDPPIMILDEPLSNLDNESRKILSRIINDCKHEKTILVFTHDSSPHLKADRKYFLN